LAEQIRTIDKKRLKHRVAQLDEESLLKVNQALEISLGLVNI
jgi:mRNA interferase MazF